ncbi:dUTP diphosphatase [Priestia megaterium]|uniref:dUTP diphosphatase n=1 Tax=Priestia megaterium TaxID=1404 RepID=UPI003D98CD0B
MNLTKLFDMQRVLDQRIIDNHPELKGQDNLDWKVLALQVELGECANEHRGFKKWSNDQEPRTAWKQPSYRGGYIERNLLLEEYVDCLHFILSIGIELELTDIEIWSIQEEGNTSQFLKCFEAINSLYLVYRVDGQVTKEIYENLFGTFVELGEILGFTWEQIEQAYFGKNEINHIRQEQGY